MIRLFPNSTYLDAYWGNQEPSEEFMSVYDYLRAKLPKHKKPSDALIWANLYDHSQTMHEAQDLFSCYDWLRTHYPSPLNTDTVPEILYAADRALEAQGYYSDLAVLKMAQWPDAPLNSYGWPYIPKNMKEHVRPSPACWRKAQCYFWDFQHSDIIPELPQNKSIAIIAAREHTDLIRLLCAQGGHTAQSLCTDRLSDIPEILRYICLLKQEQELIKPSELAALLGHTHPSVEALRHYPKAYTHLEEAKRYIEHYSHSTWFSELWALIPPPQTQLSATQARQTLKALQQHLRETDSNAWRLWTEALDPLPILKTKRSAHEWWVLYEHAAQQTTLPRPQSRVNIFPPELALYAPQDVVIYTGSYSMPAPAAKLPLIYTHEASQTKERIDSTLLELSSSSPSPAARPERPQAPKEHTEKEPHAASVQRTQEISWMKSIRSQKLCPRYGWIQRNIPFPAEDSRDSSLPVYLRGRMLHAWMASSLSAESFLTAWSEKEAYSLHPIERDLELAAMEQIKKNWQSLLSQDDWTAVHYEVPCHFTWKGYSGPLRIDCLLEHPSGCVILDFKTTQPTLNLLKTHAALAPQLPLYCLSQSAKVIAVAYVHLDPHDMRVLGYASEPLNLLAQTHTPETWKELTAQWRSEIEETLTSIFNNEQQPEPLAPYHSCTRCPVYTLCQPT